MTKEQAIEILEGIKKSNEVCIKNSTIKDTPFTIIWKRQNEAIEKVLSMLEKNKGINSLMQSRKKWKSRYYKMKNKNKDLQKSVEQIYNDYQDIGKMAFDYSDKIELQEKMIDLMAEMLIKVPENNFVAKYLNKNLEEKKKEIKQYFENKAKEVK